ncbi:MAG TPA: SDR family NAD(P)-dependent oxidoreductase [Burkholderiaceae bacterium]|jgi:non-ribosomal peptide synthase protein (TIGR01720 family)
MSTKEDYASEEHDDYDDVNNDIAIIGMAGRFPMADSVDEFWTNLVSSRDCITRFSLDELAKMGVAPAALADPHFVPAGGFIPDQDKFDAHFFEMNPREAANLDPQHRFALEVAWQTLEHAGYTPESVNGSVGVFAGVNMSTYFIFNLLKGDEATAGGDALDTQISVDKDMFASRISYKLNLNGPSVALGTACSTSLVCIHLACQSLLNGESKMALAGGSHLATPNCTGHVYHQGGYSSPDGYCRAFDAKGKGTVGGAGTCFVLLKRLDDALADNDTIYAVIKGSAVNNDGSEKIGYTAPSIVGQTNIIAEAQAVAGVEPDSIRFIEAHGTATELGDPIEFTALTRAFRLETDKKNFCGIGSVKTNIGHLGVAAGAASIVKAALSLKHKVIPESLHFESPNPKLDIANSPFYVIDKLERIEPGEYPARAGVSSLGIGGTNAHIVLEEAPEAESSESRSWQLLLLSAKTPSALDRMAENLSAYMAKTSDESIADVAYTLQVGRKGFGFRRAFVVPAEKLSRIAPNIAPTKGFAGKRPEKQKKIVFMFPGGGTQYVNMARDLYEQEPYFKQTLDTCAALFKRKMDLDVIDLIYPDDAHTEPHSVILQKPKNFFAALFAVEYSLAKLWMSWGVKPDAMIGHSLGEYTAACIAGIFTLEQAVDLICFRGALFEKIEKGSMFSVTLPAEQVKTMLIDGVSIATINDPGRCVVAGRHTPMLEFGKLLDAKQIEYQKLLIDTAGHSPMIDPIMQEFGQFLSKVKFGKSSIPFISNMSGGWAEQSEISTADYWKNHLRRTVLFSDGVAMLLKDDNTIFLEMGPGNALSSFVRAQLPEKSEAVLLNTLRHIKEEKDDQSHLLETMGKLWIAGIDIDWKAFYADEKRKRIGLPGYPFDRKRYWVENRKDVAHAGAKLPIADWLWQPGWRLEERKPAQAAADDQGTVLALLDDRRYGEGVIVQLRTKGTRVVCVTQGAKFSEIDQDNFEIAAGNSNDYQLLLKRLIDLNATPKTIFHGWSLSSATDQDQLRTNLHLSFVYLAKALEANNSDMVNIVGITNQREAILDADQVDCSQALITGPANVIPYEHPNIRFVTLDVNAATTKPEDFIRFVLNELQILTAQNGASVVHTSIALRNNLRFVKDYIPLVTEDNAGQHVDIKQNGIYVITGGLGGVGMVHAQALAAYKTRLVLLQRSAFPAEEKWNALLADANENALLKEQIKGIKALQAQGATVTVVQADVTDAAQLADAVEQIRKNVGAINGLIHCAGYGEFVTVKETSKDIIDAVLAPKVAGTDNLLQVLKNEKLDFVLLCSSMSVATTGYGLVGYVSACAYLDAIAHAHRDDPATRYVSINWDVWNTPQQAVKAQNDSVLRQKQQDNKTAILPMEGIDVIYRALSSGKPQAVISTTDFQKLLRKNRKMSDVLLADFDTNESDTTAGQDNLSLYERPSLSTEYVAPSTDEEKLLASIWQETLGISKIGVNDNFFELGGESLLGVKIVVKAKKMGLFLETKQMFATPTIGEIVKNLKKSNAVIVDQSLVMGTSPCSPIQQQFLNTSWSNKDHWNVGALLNVTQTISEPALKMVVLCLLEQHDVLRSHFVRNEQGAWQQTYTSANSDQHVAWVDLTSTTGGAFSEQVQQHCQRLQSEMHIENGPLFKLAYFKAADSAHNKLALLFHHLVMDAISLGIVIEDLQTLLAASATDRKTDMAKLLPAKTTSYKDFSTGLPTRVASLQADLLYWQNVAGEVAKIPCEMSIDIARGSNLEGDIASLSASLDADSTQRLSQQAAKHTGLKINELLLAVLAKTISDWQQQPNVIIDMVHHGRPDFDTMDFSRTVGWFGTGSPIPLKLSASPLTSQLASLKSQIQSVPQQGLSLAWLKTLHDDLTVRKMLSQIPAAAISLNYIGQINQLIAGGMTTDAQDAIRTLRDPSNQRLYQHDVIAYSQNGQIALNWNFSKKQYHEATIQGLLNTLIENLQALSNADWNAIQSSGSRHKISDATLQACGISADQIEDCYGLTAFQSEIYRRYSDESKPLANVTQAVTVMEGPIDKRLLQAVWQALVARHKVLRTRFMHDVNGEPAQVVCKHADFALIELDYSHLDEAGQQQALMQLQVKDRLTRYDLSKAPALRLYWVMLSPQAGRFAIVMSNHQIILDGWTSSLLSKDLIMCLMSMVSGKDLPAMQNQADFGRYIDWLERQSLDDALLHWRKAFDGYRHVEPLQSLMSASSSITKAEDSYAESQLVIDDNLLNSVQETARASQTTSNAVFQAAWALSLAQLSGANDVVYGATVSGRSADFDGITEIIGQCTNSLPVRVSLASDMTVAQLLQVVHRANAQAQTHNLPSLKQIANAIGHTGNDNLYSSNFIFENIPRADSGGVELPIKTIAALWTDGWQFPLRVFIVPEEKTWVRFAFDKSRFAITDIEKLAQRYQKNLIELTKSIHAPVLQITV